jgi:hypothetical protein
MSWPRDSWPGEASAPLASRRGGSKRLRNGPPTELAIASYVSDRHPSNFPPKSVASAGPAVIEHRAGAVVVAGGL